MADPARTEVKHSPTSREVVLVVGAKERDGVVVDVGDEAGRGVEGGVWGGVGAGKVRGCIGEGGMAWGVGPNGEVGRWRCGRGCGHGREESGDREGE